MTYSGIGDWEGVRFYVDVPRLATDVLRATWKRMYGDTIRPEDQKKIFSQAEKARDKNVKLNAKFEYDKGAAKKIAIGTGVALVAVGGCAIVVGCGPAAAAGAAALSDC